MHFRYQFRGYWWGCDGGVEGFPLRIDVSQI